MVVMFIPYFSFDSLPSGLSGCIKQRITLLKKLQKKNECTEQNVIVTGPSVVCLKIIFLGITR